MTELFDEFKRRRMRRIIVYGSVTRYGPCNQLPAQGVKGCIIFLSLSRSLNVTHSGIAIIHSSLVDLSFDISAIVNFCNVLRMWVNRLPLDTKRRNYMRAKVN